MKLENQVSSLELSKKLKELGINQESLFKWHGEKNNWEIKLSTETSSNISAFTVAELGEMLPEEINFPLKNGKARKWSHSWGTRKCKLHAQGMWVVTYSNYYARETYKKYAETEADARAKMLVYLIENKLITI